jgi:hypothetical protein
MPASRSKHCFVYHLTNRPSPPAWLPISTPFARPLHDALQLPPAEHVSRPSLGAELSLPIWRGAYAKIKEHTHTNTNTLQHTPNPPALGLGKRTKLDKHL